LSTCCLKKRQVGFHGDFKHIQVFGEKRIELLEIIDEAQNSGLSLSRVCKILKLDRRRVQRWRKLKDQDRKPYSRQSKPYNALLDQEKEIVATMVASKEYADASCRELSIKALENHQTYISHVTF
jgi:DNA-binding transcriptional MerR regulator